MGTPRLREPAGRDPGIAGADGSDVVAGRRRLSDRFRRASRVGVGADTALSSVMAATTAGANYVLRLVVLAALAGPEEAGRYQLLIAFLAMGSSLADFGLTAAIMPRLARARGTNSLALRASMNVRLVWIAAVGLSFNAYFLASGRSDLLLPFDIAYLGCYVSARLLGVRNTLDLLWRLKGRAWVAGSFVVLDSMLALVVLLIVSASTTITVTIVAVVWTASSIPGFLLALIPLAPELRRAEILRRPIPARYYRGIVAAAAPVGLTLFLGQVAGQLETLVLNWSGTLADVGHYGVAIAPLSGILFIPGVIGSGLAPVVSQLVRGGRSDPSLSWFSSMATRAIGLIALSVAALAMLFADEMLRLFPSEYVGGGYIVRLYAVTTALTFIVVVYDGFLIAIGRNRRLLIGAIIGVVGALVLEVALVGPFGIRGILVGRIIALGAVVWFQLASFQPEMRSGALSGLLHLAGPAAAFAIVYVVTEQLPLPAQAALSIGAVAAAVVVARTIRVEEIRRIRSLTIS